MQTANKVTNFTKKFNKNSDIVYPKISHIYKAKNGLWRGFVTPYDISFEAKTKKKVEEVLPKLIILYEDGLKKYNYPTHLMSVPFSDKEDIDEFDKYLESWKDFVR